jgi:hypothetical protein
MDYMILGSYTFAKNPSNPVPRIEKRLIKSVVDTHDNFASFTFARTDQYCGIELPYKWKIMDESMYESLQTIYLADAQVVFQPKNGDSRTFYVEVISLSPGTAYLVMDGTTAKRLDVELTLKIRSLVP